MTTTLLAVDDSKTMRKVIEITFASEDFRLILCSNADEAMSKLGERPAVSLHVSETGRALQTMAMITDILGLDWFAAQRTDDLKEIDMGAWCGRLYEDVEAEIGPIVLADHLLRPAPDGEDYPMIAARLTRWLGEVGNKPGDHVVVMHGISSRVLRGIMAGYPIRPDLGVPIAPSLVQGSIALIVDGKETVLFGSERGTEHA